MSYFFVLFSKAWILIEAGGYPQRTWKDGKLFGGWILLLLLLLSME